MRIKSILLLLVCFLLSGLTMPAIACPPGDCDDCETWNTETEVCDWVCTTEQCCYNDFCVDDCSGCQDCVNDYCEDNDDNCEGCRSCEGGWCNTDDDNCEGCEICNEDSICEDDDDSCLSYGPCKTCVDAVCEDDDTKCSGCKTCDGGSCEDDDDECIGCERCISGFCEDDDNECGDCGFCFLGICYDDDDQCLDCQNCINNYCYDACPSGEKCCPDETCHDECQNTPTGDCDSSNSEECQICFMPGAGITCLDLTTKVYTGNINQSCSGGCPGDCEDKPDMLCYTEYKCAHKDVLEDYACVVFGNGEWGCTGPDMIIFCPRCKKDPEDQGEKYYRPHQACK